MTGTITWIGFEVDAEVARKVDRSADAHGVPRNFVRAIVLAESSGHPEAIGDAGHSVGLLQLYDQGGQGTGMSVAARKDPDTNLKVGMPYIRAGWQMTSDITPMRERVKRAAALSGHPGNIASSDPRLVKIADYWERLEGVDPTPDRTVSVAGVALEPGRIGEQSSRAWAFVQDHPVEAAGLVLGVLAVLAL